MPWLPRAAASTCGHRRAILSSPLSFLPWARVQTSENGGKDGDASLSDLEQLSFAKAKLSSDLQNVPEYSEEVLIFGLIFINALKLSDRQL